MFPSFRSYKQEQAHQSYGNGRYPNQKYQTQSQSYMRRNKKKQKEKVAFAQQFQDQTDAVSFYFTKSGKQSKFVNAKKRKETDELDDILMSGCCDNDDDSNSAESPVENINAVIQCSRKNSLGGHQGASPCLILQKPTKHQSKFNIRMAAPFETEEYWVHPDQFQLSTKESFVSSVEKDWMKHYGTFLGYDSIEQRNNPNLNACDEDEEDYGMDYEQEEEEVAINGVIKLSKNKKLRRHARTMPCLILAEPNKNERKFHIRLAAPFEKETYWVSPGQYTIERQNEKYIAQIERDWANYHQVPLGYKSVEQRQQEMYPDVY